MFAVTSYSDLGCLFLSELPNAVLETLSETPLQFCSKERVTSKYDFAFSKGIILMLAFQEILAYMQHKIKCLFPY